MATEKPEDMPILGTHLSFVLKYGHDTAVYPVRIAQRSHQKPNHDVTHVHVLGTRRLRE